MSAPRNNSVASTSTIGSIRSFASEHHKAVNGAFQQLYGGPFEPTARSNSAVYSGSEETLAKKNSVWSSIKSAAKQFHRDTNGAVIAVYGQGTYRNEDAKVLRAEY
jgi:hypothetical protein